VRKAFVMHNTKSTPDWVHCNGRIADSLLSGEEFVAHLQATFRLMEG